MAYGCAEANKQLDSLFKAEVQSFKANITAATAIDKQQSKLIIYGTYSENKTNIKYSRAYIKAINKLFKECGYKVSEKKDPYNFHFPNLPDQLARIKREIRAYQEYCKQKLYYIIPTLEYHDVILQMKIEIFDPEDDQMIDLGKKSIAITDLVAADTSSGNKTSQNGYVRIPNRDYLFRVYRKGEFTKLCDNEDSRNLHFQAGKYVIKFRDIRRIKKKFVFNLQGGDSLSISIQRIHTPKSKLDNFLKGNFLFPGSGYGLFPKFLKGTADEWTIKTIYLSATLGFYTNLYRIIKVRNYPSNRNFLSENARKKYTKEYHRYIARTCALYAINIGLTFLIYYSYFDKHIELKPTIIDLKNYGQMDYSDYKAVYGLNLQINLGQ
jgi:hypothetical protein